jgi:hypothetical protein
MATWVSPFTLLVEVGKAEVGIPQARVSISKTMPIAIMVFVLNNVFVAAHQFPPYLPKNLFSGT